MSTPHWKKLKQAVKLHFSLQDVAVTHEEVYREYRAEPRRSPLIQKLIIRVLNIFFNSICVGCCPNLVFRRRRSRSPPLTIWKRIFFDGSLENQILKSCVGFFVGVALTLLIFYFTIYEMRLNPRPVTKFCITISCFLTFGLAFSKRGRLFVLLILLQFFTGRGRVVLLGYAMLLVVNGPVHNTVYNTNVMVENVICGEELLAKKAMEMTRGILSPLIAIKDTVKRITESIRSIAIKLKEALFALQTLFQEIEAAIRGIFSWLVSIPDICNERMGEPYQNCVSAFDDAIDDCKEKLGPVKFLCEIVAGIQQICNTVRVGELFCLLSSYVETSFVDKLEEKIKEFIQYIEEMVYVGVYFAHDYNYTIEQSRSYSGIAEDIKKSVSGKITFIEVIADWSNGFLVVTVVLLIFKAWQYQRKYMTVDNFDNIYITYHIMELDVVRLRKNKETILPLRYRENNKYVKTFSLRLVKSEKFSFIRSLGLIIISAIQTACYLIIDYTLFWILAMIQHHRKRKTQLEVPVEIGAVVDGEGFMADIVRSIGEAFDPLSMRSFNDSSECIPNPRPPDYNIYEAIGIIFLICVAVILVESHGLRLRHVVAAWYHPKRERERGVWLYNRILRNRRYFLPQIRRRLRRQKLSQCHRGNGLRERVTKMCPMLSSLCRCVGWNIFDRQFCIVCGKAGIIDDRFELLHCSSSGCCGIYCSECYVDMNNLCTFCRKPSDYGDVSDISEEMDSSEDDVFERKPLLSPTPIMINKASEKIKKPDYVDDTDLADLPTSQAADDDLPVSSDEDDVESGGQ